MAGVEGRPLYRRIESDLRERIRAGALAPGARVPTELELMDRYGVSRATVRQALGGLIATGALEVRRGLGTYVAAGRFEHTIGGLTCSAGRSSEAAGSPGRGCSTWASSPPTSRSQTRSSSTSERRRRAPRIRLADDEPIVVETSRLPAARFPGLETVDFATVRLYDTLTSVYGCRPTRARETFEPILLTANEAELLGQRRGGPALRVERVAYDRDDRPIEHCRSTVRGDRYRYAVELRDR